MTRYARHFAATTLTVLFCGFSTMPTSAAEALTKVKLSGREISLIPDLTAALGHFKQEGLDVTMVKADEILPHEYMMQASMNKGQIDAAVAWFQHVIYGAGNNAPVKAVMLLNDSPGATVMVANRVKDEVKSAADFKGRNVAEGAGLSTKSIVTNYLAHKAGLPPHSYTPAMIDSDGRLAAITKGLQEGKVDVMTFLEPMTTALQQTNMVTTLYDLTSKEGTIKALGAPWAAQSVFVTPTFIEAHPDTVQRLVNAFVRTMRFVNSHTAEEIAAKLPASYFEDKKDQQAEINKIRKSLSTYAHGDYSFSPAAVKLVVDSIRNAPFDDSEEGHFRANSKKAKLEIDQLYTNKFVEKAMREIK